MRSILLTAILCGLTTPVFAQTPSAPGYPAGAARGLNEGVAVHGDWIIEVRNHDGSLSHRREFKNAFVGDYAVTSILMGLKVPYLGGLSWRSRLPVHGILRAARKHPWESVRRPHRRRERRSTGHERRRHRQQRTPGRSYFCRQHVGRLVWTLSSSRRFLRIRRTGDVYVSHYRLPHSPRRRPDRGRDGHVVLLLRQRIIMSTWSRQLAWWGWRRHRWLYQRPRRQHRRAVPAAESRCMATGSSPSTTPTARSPRELNSTTRWSIQR